MNVIIVDDDGDDAVKERASESCTVETVVSKRRMEGTCVRVVDVGVDDDADA